MIIIICRESNAGIIDRDIIFRVGINILSALHGNCVGAYVLENEFIAGSKVKANIKSCICGFEVFKDNYIAVGWRITLNGICARVVDESILAASNTDKQIVAVVAI